MARMDWGKTRGGRQWDRLDRSSRLYDSSSMAKGHQGEEETASRPGGERDAVRNFLQAKKLPTAAKRRPFYSDGSGLPLDAEPPQLRSKATPVAKTFNDLLKVCCDIDQEKFLKQEKMKAAWPALLGPDLAEKLTFEKFEDGVIYAFARNSVELFEIRQFKLRSIEMKAKRTPAFKGVRQIRLKCR